MHLGLRRQKATLRMLLLDRKNGTWFKGGFE
jgi:hypothetical protein